MRLAHKHIILTGASRGFGRYLAHVLWREGASLLLVARKWFSLDLDVACFPDQTVNIVSADLSVPYVENVILRQAHIHWSDAVDGLVNNAAIQGPVGPAWENGWGEWSKTLNVNLRTPVALCQAVVPKMLKRSKGKIVNLSGGGATSARPNYSAYATAKTGLVRFSECLAAELAGTGIDVNCVAPGKMYTDMLPKGEKAEVKAMEKAAELVVWLLSDESNGVTGKLIAAQWDNYKALLEYAPSDKYTLRRVTE